MIIDIYRGYVCVIFMTANLDSDPLNWSIHVIFVLLIHLNPIQMGLLSHLTLKHRETHGCVVSTVATDALVLKHQAISIHNAD